MKNWRSRTGGSAGQGRTYTLGLGGVARGVRRATLPSPVLSIRYGTDIREWEYKRRDHAQSLTGDLRWGLWHTQ
jgi:hypothetical protein